MSVLTYVYPGDPAAIRIERLLRHVRTVVPGIALTDVQLKKRMEPDWQSVTFGVPSSLDSDFLFVVVRNLKRDVAQMAASYGNAKEWRVVSSSPIVIRAQHIMRNKVPEKQLFQDWDAFVSVLCAVASLSKGVVYSPENERLFSWGAFQRHQRKHRLASI